MCQQTFSVVGLEDQRKAYEVEEFLTGMQNVDHANADFLNDEIIVEYDETQIAQDAVLDGIEYAGCKPEERIDGVIDSLRAKIGY